MFKWKVHRVIIRAKLEPYLGFLHSVQYGKPSLVCDLQELYRKREVIFDVKKNPYNISIK